MQQINSAAGLRDAIVQLERRQAAEGEILKEQFRLVYEGVKPLNLLKSVFMEAADSHDLKVSMLNTFIGMTTGYLSKKLFESVTKSPFKKLAGNAVMIGITNDVEEHPDFVFALGRGILGLFRKKPDHGGRPDLR